MLTALDAQSDALDQFEKPFVASIREYGWYRTSVSGDDEGPGFSYTTGFFVHTNQPELLMFGMPTVVHDVFWDLYRDAQQDIALQIGKRSDQVFGNLPAYAFHISKRYYRGLLGWSRWFYAGDEFPCLQLVWPDRAGIFPWQRGFDPAFENRQIDLTESGWNASVLDS